jgi:polyphosphate kinase
VYGIVNHKVHCKVTLVVRKDDDGLRRYLHLGTGNYNPGTARVYTDLSLFTANPDFGEDATNLFNLLTGICQFQGARKLLISPFTVHETIMAMIRRETENAVAKKPARIIAKMNSLVDQEVIEALYQASQAGVKVELIVRGVCCLRPGVPGVSENITVRSIVGRFLEHSRIFYFENNAQPKIFVGSADWMPRNFFRRIEVVFPIEEPSLRDRISNQILATQLADTAKASLLNSEGVYQRPQVRKESELRNSQSEFMALALGESKPRKRRRVVTSRFPEVRVERAPKTL